MEALCAASVCDANTWTLAGFFPGNADCGNWEGSNSAREKVGKEETSTKKEEKKTKFFVL